MEQIVEFKEELDDAGFSNPLIQSKLDEIDDLLMRLHYFSKFPFILRKELLKIGQIRTYKKNEVIFS